jgi:hypothetical protein
MLIAYMNGIWYVSIIHTVCPDQSQPPFFLPYPTYSPLKYLFLDQQVNFIILAQHIILLKTIFSCDYYLLVVQALRRLGQENHEFEASLVYTLRFCLQNKTTPPKQQQ